MRPGKRKEGRPLKDTQEMKMWREEYDQMPIEEQGTATATALPNANDIGSPVDRQLGFQIRGMCG